MVGYGMRYLCLALAAVALSGCLATNYSSPFQRNSVQTGIGENRGEWWLLADSQTHTFQYNPYNLTTERDGSWSFRVHTVEKSTGRTVRPSLIRINCVANTFSEDAPHFGSSEYRQSFRPIPSGGPVAQMRGRLCGTRWPIDNQTYYFLGTSSASPTTDLWIRGNRVRHDGDIAELVILYSDRATNDATPVQVIVDCKRQTIREVDFATKKPLRDPMNVTPNTNRLDAVVYDRACNESRVFITRTYDKPRPSAPVAEPSQTKRLSAERRCEALGIARGTQPFSVCVQQLSSE